MNGDSCCHELMIVHFHFRGYLVILDADTDELKIAFSNYMLARYSQGSDPGLSPALPSEALVQLCEYETSL